MSYRFAHKIFVTLFASVLLAGYSAAAMAAPTGCDPAVLAAMKAKAEAETAYDVAVTEQVIKKPDSVLAMTCFNQAAGVAAKKAGAIFSGDFTDDLAPLIEDALVSFYDDFDGSIGRDSNTVDYAATQLSDTYDCDAMAKLWDEVTGNGVSGGLPPVTLDDLIADNPPPNAGDAFEENWNASADQGIFQALDQSMQALTAPTIPSFEGANSSCAVLQQAGIIDGPCG